MAKKCVPIVLLAPCVLVLLVYKKKRFNKLWLSIALKWLEFTESLLQNYNKLLIQQKNVCL